MSVRDGLDEGDVRWRGNEGKVGELWGEVRMG